MKVKDIVEKLPFNSRSVIYKMVDGRLTEVAVCSLESFTDKTHKYKGRYANSQVIAMNGRIQYNSQVSYEIYIK